MFKALRDRFKTPAAPLSAAETVLRNRRVKYTKQPDGTLLVRGNLDFSSRGMKELPDLSSVVVEGNFTCYSSGLTSLRGAPRSVGGDVNLDRNQLNSLEGTLQTVGGTLRCCNMPLKTLAGAPGLRFNKLVCDFGEFTALVWVPFPLLQRPEERARLLAETPAGAPGLAEHLLWALHTREEEAVREALRKGADANAGGGLPLLAAAGVGNVKFGVLLMAAGADFDQALATADKQPRRPECWEEASGFTFEPGDHIHYSNPGKWLRKNKASLVEGFLEQKLGALAEENAALKQKSAALQKALDDLHRPADPGKPKLTVPKAF